MRGTTEQDRPEPPSVGRRLAWFFGIAAVSGVAVAVAAEILRWLILH